MAFPSVGRGVMSSSNAAAAAGGRDAVGAMLASSLADFTAMRRPWNDYLGGLPKADSEPLSPPLNPKPMYRGRKVGREGWLFNEKVQLHYRRYPDEGLLTNVARWRYGDTINDVDLQQFKNAQPHILDREDEQGFKRPSPEVYFRLNYKNPAVLSRFLTRTGHYYPQDVLPLNPQAVKMHRRALGQARKLGLYPKFGNPFWFRVQQFRPKVSDALYDPVESSLKSTTEHFAFNWLQTHRVKTYFEQARTRASEQLGGKGKSLAKNLAEPSGALSPGSKYVTYNMAPTDVDSSPKVTTVPGLMSIKGLRKPPNLYSSDSKKRMGFPNPLGTTLRI